MPSRLRSHHLVSAPCPDSGSQVDSLGLFYSLLATSLGLANLLRVEHLAVVLVLVLWVSRSDEGRSRRECVEACGSLGSQSMLLTLR